MRTKECLFHGNKTTAVTETADPLSFFPLDYVVYSIVSFSFVNIYFSKFLKNPAPQLKGGEFSESCEQQLQQGARRVLIRGDRVKEGLKVERVL